MDTEVNKSKGLSFIFLIIQNKSVKDAYNIKSLSLNQNNMLQEAHADLYSGKVTHHSYNMQSSVCLCTVHFRQCAYPILFSSK
jgi:hypothetical protein